MNIAFLTPEYPHLDSGPSGGLGSSIKILAQALTDAGHTVRVYVYGQSADDQVADGNVKLIRIRNVRFKGLSWWLTRKKIQRIINYDCKTYGIDILEVPDWTGISAWIHIRCKIVMRLHGSDTYFCALENRKVKWWNTFQEQTAYSQADGIIAVSKFVGKQTNTIFKSNKPFTVVHNGIPTNILIPEETSAPSTPCILYFGTLIRKKGVLDIPLIFNNVINTFPNVRLLLIGADASDIHSGNSSTWALMKPLFTEQALKKVTYLGKVPHDSINQHIQKATLCIFPSYAEACPVSWLEAMAMGKAIVSSNIGWSTEIVSHKKTGFVCHPSDHTKFADYITFLLQNPEARKKIGENAHTRMISEFNSLNTAQQTVDFYTQLLRKNGV